MNAKRFEDLMAKVIYEIDPVDGAPQWGKALPLQHAQEILQENQELVNLARTFMSRADELQEELDAIKGATTITNYLIGKAYYQSLIVRVEEAEYGEEKP